MRTRLFILFVVLGVAAGCGAKAAEPRRSSINVKSSAKPDDFKTKPDAVLLSPVAPPPAPIHDPDDLAKYINHRVLPYLSAVQREPDGRFLLVFKGGAEAVNVPSFDDLMGIELVEVEKHSIVLQVRQRTTLRISLHDSRAHEGGVVKIQPKPR